jgi:hypothetical protein
MVSANLYEYTLPQFECGGEVKYFLSAKTAEGVMITDPYDAPEVSFTTVSAYNATAVFSDDFNSNNDWVVQNSPYLTDGAWDRGIPAGGGDRGDPYNDYDSSGYCFLTDNEDGNSDVDGGRTYLISPPFDLSAGSAAIVYSFWYTNYTGTDPNDDLFKVYLSSDDGSSWNQVEAFGPNTFSGWTKRTLVVGNYIMPTDQVRIRFEASDLNDSSTVEAGIDAIKVLLFNCDAISYAYFPGDVNMYNGAWQPAVIGSDVTYLVNYFRGSRAANPCRLSGFWASADANGDCNVIGSDVTYLINFMRGGMMPAYCPVYEPAWHSGQELPAEPPDGWPGCEP